MRASIIIPTFNETQNMPELLRRIHETLDSKHEVIIVDDGTDDLPDAVQRERADYGDRSIEVLRRESATGGLGGAIAAGVNLAQGDIIVVCDGDLQHPPETIPHLLAALEDVDIAVASRYCAGARHDGLSSQWRILASRGSGLLSKLLFPKKLANCSDPMSGFFAVRRHYILQQQLQPNGFKILLELLLRAEDPRLAEIPYAFARRTNGSSNFSALEGFRLLKKLLELRGAGRKVKLLRTSLAKVMPTPLVISAHAKEEKRHPHRYSEKLQIDINPNCLKRRLRLWQLRRTSLKQQRLCNTWCKTRLACLLLVKALTPCAGLRVLDASLFTLDAPGPSSLADNVEGARNGCA